MEKIKSEAMFSLRVQFMRCLQGMYTIKCSSVDINQQTRTRKLYMHTSFISARTYNFCSRLRACYQSVPSLAEYTSRRRSHLYCQILRQVLSDCVARSAELPTGQVR